MPESVAHEARTAAAKLTLPEVLERVGPELAEIEARLASLERPDVPLTAEIMDHVLALRGKRVRPLLLLLVSRLGKKPDREGVLWASTVIELVHTATLLHDDCIDLTRLRRGLPTVNHRWGQQAAILMGDYLFTKGFDLLSEHGIHAALTLLTRHTLDMTEGMNREFASRHRADLSEDEYLTIIRQKTGALFVASCEIGAVLGGLSEDAARDVSAFGRDLGLAFQIVDDVIDFTGSPAETGKPTGQDFRLGFATLPLVYAFERGDPERADRVAAVFSRGDVGDDEWEESRRFVLASGGVEAARERALELALAARERLAAFDGSDGVAPLLAAVEYVVARGR
jgi:octaprenyl-diphosphate synthase